MPSRGAPAPTHARGQGPPISLEALARQLQRVEQQNAMLAEQNRSLVKQLDAVTSRYDQLNRRLEQIEPRAGLPMPPLPAPVPLDSESPFAAARLFRKEPGPSQDPGPGSGIASGETWATSDFPATAEPLAGPVRPEFSRFLVGEYDDDRGQFVLVRPRDEQRVPFELRLDLFTQARYSNFARSANSWVDSTGTRLPVQSFESVEVMRNFIHFSGFGIDPRLQFSAFIFSSTALNDTVYLGWINYHFSKAFDLRVGNWSVPGTREWYESFRFTLGADRLMATTFFRPNISPGIWAQGEPIENFHYVAMLANSLNRFSQGVERIGSGFTFGGTVWWEPMGDFGLGPSDIENHQSLSPRIGTNLALSRERNQGFGAYGLGNPEDTILRLSDGTPLFRPGALGPGVELISAGVQLWTIDAAVKYHGLSLSGEYFFRWLDTFKEAGAGRRYRSLFDHGRAAPDRLLPEAQQARDLRPHLVRRRPVRGRQRIRRWCQLVRQGHARLANDLRGPSDQPFAGAEHPDRLPSRRKRHTVPAPVVLGLLRPERVRRRGSAPSITADQWQPRPRPMRALRGLAECISSPAAPSGTTAPWTCRTPAAPPGTRACDRASKHSPGPDRDEIRETWIGWYLGSLSLPWAIRRLIISMSVISCSIDRFPASSLRRSRISWVSVGTRAQVLELIWMSQSSLIL